MDAEPFSEYRKGGFHPVHIGDIIGEEQRYRVIHKLGHGGFATVWLATDSKSKRYVALKIMKAEESSEECPETSILPVLQASPEHPGKQHIAWPLDHFWVEGPNGSHFCVVMPFVGPPFTKTWVCNTLTGKMTRKISQEVAQCVEFFHENGICHGDLCPSNMLLQIANVDTWSEEQIYERLGHPIKRATTEVQAEMGSPNKPRYLVMPIDNVSIDFCYLSDQIKLVDFGEAFYIKEPPPGLGTLMEYCSPELIMEDKAGPPSDIWALACTFYALRVGHPLFETFFGDENQVLEQMVSLFGKLPQAWWELWEGRNKIFDEDGNAKCSSEDGSPIVKPYTLKELLREPVERLPRMKTCRKYPEQQITVITLEERDVFADLLQKMTKFGPEDRPSINEILAHPWFKKSFPETPEVESYLKTLK